MTPSEWCCDVAVSFVFGGFAYCLLRLRNNYMPKDWKTTEDDDTPTS